MAAAHDLSSLGPGVVVMMMDDNAQDRADRVGKHVSKIVIALLGALFAYGYPGPLVLR